MILTTSRKSGQPKWLIFAGRKEGSHLIHASCLANFSGLVKILDLID